MTRIHSFIVLIVIAVAYTVQIIFGNPFHILHLIRILAAVTNVDLQIANVIILCYDFNALGLY